MDQGPHKADDAVGKHGVKVAARVFDDGLLCIHTALAMEGTPFEYHMAFSQSRSRDMTLPKIAV